MSEQPPLHILSVLVENKFGVLARVAGLFSRRGFNIFSLAVAPTDDPTRSRITIVVNVEDTAVDQIAKQLNKLINVLEITELHPDESVERELMLAHLEVPADDRHDLHRTLEPFAAKILDEDGLGVIVSVSDSPARLDACAALLRAYGITEMQRTGRVALRSLSGGS